MKDTANMTALSQYMYRAATSRKLSLKEAVAQLKNDANIRTTKDILMRFSGLAPEEESNLQSFVCRALAETSSDLSRDSIRRKVSIWINDNGAISKAAAIQLSFAFKLSYDKADEFLKFICSEGFHWRDPEDIIFGYSLLNGLSYQEACALKSRMSELGLIAASKQQDNGDDVMLTNQIQDTAKRLSSEEELRDFLQSESGNLGTMHNTAYSIFVKYMDILQNPEVDPMYEEGLFSEEKNSSDFWNALCSPDAYSIREILMVYLHNSHIPHETRPRKGSKADTDSKNALILSAMQKNIRAYWPDEITLSKMKSRLIDVSRKVLILLFVAVDGYEETEYDDFEDELTPEEQFEDMYQRLNNMLHSCGFSPLDSRIPFDWMILFCMCSGSKDFIDSRIERFLKGVFIDQPKA